MSGDPVPPNCAGEIDWRVAERLAERRLSRLQIGVCGDRALDQGIEVAGSVQRPPFSGKVTADGKGLARAACGGRGDRLIGQRRGGIAFDVWRRGDQEIRTNGATSDERSAKPDG